MKSHAQPQRQPQESGDRFAAKIQPRPFHDPLYDLSHCATADFSHVDLFRHAPQRGIIQAKFGVNKPNEPDEKKATPIPIQNQVGKSIADNESQTPAKIDLASFKEPVVFSPSSLVIQKAEFGLADEKILDHFTKSTIGVGKTLTTKGTKATLCQIIKVIHELLNKQGIPLPKFFYKPEKDKNTQGYFKRSEWSITINSTAYPDQETAIDRIPNLLETLYHETRHCEQYFRSARLMAVSYENNAERIANDLGIPLKVAEEAIKNPYPSKKSLKQKKKSQTSQKSNVSSKEETEVVQQWLKEFTEGTKISIASDKMPDKMKVESQLNEANAYLENYKNLAKTEQGSKKNEFERYEKQFNENYEKYRNWKHEEDAWSIGGKVASKYKKIIQDAIDPIKRNYLIEIIKLDGEQQKLLLEHGLNVQSIQQESQVRLSKVAYDQLEEEKQNIQSELAKKVKVLVENFKHLTEIKERTQVLSSEKYQSDDQVQEAIRLLKLSAECTIRGEMVGAGNAYIGAISILKEKGLF
jgi:hypothetical protein